MNEETPQLEEPSPREPIFNIPGIILTILVGLALIHVYRNNFLDQRGAAEFLIRFSYIPARYVDPQFTEFSPLALYWSPLTYSLLHADWAHYLVNGFWLLAFGGVVAKRMGWQRFIVLFLLGAVAGAGLHHMTHYGELIPMIGASASVSACVGAAARFAFPAHGRFSMNAEHLPRLSLWDTLSNRQVIMFIAIWFAINIVVGSGVIDIDGSGNTVAWEAHIGGFLAGLFFFGLLDQSR